MTMNQIITLAFGIVTLLSLLLCFTLLMASYDKKEKALVEKGLRDGEIEKLQNLRKSKIFKFKKAFDNLFQALLTCVLLVVVSFSLIGRYKETGFSLMPVDLKVIASNSMASKNPRNTYLVEEGLDNQFKVDDIILLRPLPKAEELKLYDVVAYNDRTIIIEGGPGTGKSVISFNLLGRLLKESLNTVFVAPNAAFRDVMTNRLARNNKKSVLKYLITGSGRFYGLEENSFDVIIVDEAHRLKSKNAYGYSGENQIEDIISSSCVSIFFIDDNQKIRPEDIGSVENITSIARKFNSEVYKFKLETQFRCSGADSYIDWLDYVFQIDKSKKVSNWQNTDLDFRLIDDPNDVYHLIKNWVSQGLKARMLAGYAWKWTKEGNANAEVEDVCIPEYGFCMPWNSRSSRTTWADDDEGINQIGCIHTSQGLEFDYVGVIIGKDLRYNEWSNEIYADWNSYKDNAGKKGLKLKPQMLTNLVKNIYKTLLTRGLKGCYVFIYDEGLKKYFKKELEKLKSKHF